MKSKKSSSLSTLLSCPEKYAGSFSKDRDLVDFSALSEGDNAGKLFVVGVSSIIPAKDKVP